MFALQVFAVGLGDEVVDLGRIHADGHALLRFGNRQFGAIEAVILFGNRVEVDLQRRSNFADRHRDTACAKVVADFDFAGQLRVAEQALDLALGRGVALLDFGGIFQRGVRVFLGRTGRATHTITTRASTDQQNHIAGGRGAAEHLRTWGRCHHRTDLHALGHIAGVIDLRHLAGRQTDLVAVRRVTAGRHLADLLLRQLAGQRLGKRSARIACARHTHRLIDIRAAGKGIADATAQASRGTAKRLDFRRVVVRFVFKHHQPLFGDLWNFRFQIRDFHRHHDRGRVDFFRNFEVVEFAGFPQLAHADQGDVHQRDRLVLAGQLLAGVQVGCPGALHRLRALAEADLIDLGQEGGVAAVVGPIRVQHPDLGQAWVALLLVAEIALAESDVSLRHRQPE